MKPKKTVKSIALFFVIGLIIFNVIGLSIYKNEIDDHLRKKINTNEIVLDSLSKFSPEEITQKFGEKIGVLINNYFSQKLSQKNHLANLKMKRDRSFSIKEKAYKEYKCECEGTCGTAVRGRGSECERKEQNYINSNAEYIVIKTLFDSENKNAKISTLKKKTQESINIILENKIKTSYLERMKTFWELLF